jgi:hypothetical protein
MAEIADKLTARLAAIDEAIANVQRNAEAEVQRLRQAKVLLQRAQVELTPDREALLGLLKREGVI